MEKRTIKAVANSIFCLFSLSVLSCSNPNSYNSEQHSTGNEHIKSSIKDCILERDTVFTNNNTIKYVVVDTYYTVFLKIGNRDTMLGYRFDCSIPNGLVPSIHSANDSTICLISGSGEHYRVFDIWYLDAGFIRNRTYETALATDMRNNIVVHQNPDSLKCVYVENLRSGERKTVLIPDSYNAANIAQANVNSKNIHLTFTDGKQYSFAE